MKCLSLFSGAGGMDIGVAKAGFDIILSTDIDPTCCQTLEANQQITGAREVVLGDMRDVDLSVAQNVDIVVGGSPCQPFSKSRHWSDPSNSKKYFSRILPFLFLEAAANVGAKAFIFENVPGLFYKRNEKIFNEIIARAKKLGFKEIKFKILNAADFGVAQRRKRLFIVGFTKRNGFSFSDIKTVSEWTPCKDVLADLKPVEIDDALKVNGKWGKYLPLIPPGHNYLYLTKKAGSKNPIFEWRSRYWNFLLKLDPEKPSWTIQATPGPYTGPFHWDNRRLSIPELKRLQGLPDEYKIYGDRQEKIRQIGNCVPPAVARAVAEETLNYL
jgi:DNA (cytosine-5)-methyltransferase 1